MSYRRLVQLALTLALASLVSGSAHAQRRKLNGPLATAYLTDVASFDLASGRIVYVEGSQEVLTVPMNGSAPAQSILHREAGGLHGARLTPNGARVVLTGRLDPTTGRTELFSLPAEGSGPPAKLNAPLPSNSDIYSFEISPDSQYVVYRLVWSGGSVDTGFSVRTDGSQPAVSLNGPYVVRFPAITPDSSQVLFLSYNNRLYSVPIAGGTPTLVHPPLGGQRWGVQEFVFTPDGSRVVYRLDFDAPGVLELYSKPLDGSGPQVKLNGPLVAGGDVWRFQISPFSTHVSYVADQDVDEVPGLYGAPIGGGTVIQFSPGMAERYIVEERITPDHSHMVYLANHETESRLDFLSVPVDGSHAPVNLSGTITGTGAYAGFLTDPLTGRVVFRVGRPSGTVELYSADPYADAPAVRLSPAGLTAGVPSGGFAIASGSRVVFLADPSAPGQVELFSVPIDGSVEAIRLHPPLVAGGEVYSFVLDAGGTRALYRGEQDLAGVIELFVVPVDGSAAPTLRSTIRDHLSTVGDVGAFALTPDGATAVYQADEAAAWGLYAVNLEGSPQRVRLADGFDFVVTPDSRRAVYRGSFPTLYSVPIDASAGPILLSTQAFLWSWKVSPDSSRLVHLHQADFYSDPNRLFSTPVLGGSAPIELNVPRTSSGEIRSYQVSPDSARVVYAGSQQTAGVVELFSVPLAGGAAPVKLNDALVAGGNVVAAPTISLDSSRVVYLADRDANDELELYSVPIAGGMAPTELSTLPGPERDVTSLAISPDSARVVYLADQDEDEVYELYSVPLAGGTAPVKLSAFSGPGRDVSHTGQYYGDAPFQISPDSSWVVYRADQDTNDEFELYRVPLAGGSAPLRLTFGTAAGTLSGIALISPDSADVVYWTRSSGRTDLFRVPMAGGSPVRLNGLAPVEDAYPSPIAAIDPSGSWVLFYAALHQAGVKELFAAPIQSGPVPVNSALGSGTVRGSFRPGASSVVYSAPQDEAGVIELYINELLTTEPDRHRPR